MTVVFMKWLETRPKDYDRGIRLLTLGKLNHINEIIVREYIRAGTCVLEIGCGTGTLTQMMAQRGAIVTGVDASAPMLAEAEKTIQDAKLEERVTLQHMDATLIEERFPPASFDVIVSTLMFSEIPVKSQRLVLAACKKLLKPNGRLVIADEVTPTKPVRRLLYTLVRLPLVLLTWLVTRTTTHSLREFDSMLAQIGFRTKKIASYLGGGLVLFESFHVQSSLVKPELDPRMIEVLRHHVTLRRLLLNLWLLFFRIIPPYPKVKTGLYAIGSPSADSPVLVTGNFDLTVRRLVRALDGKVNVWLLVADSAGINVWCGAGGGYFTAEKIIAAIKSSHLEEVVNHHVLILPQLCANGVNGWRIRSETGWGVRWGPARADDIPAYLAQNYKKTDEMRRVNFPLKDRLEMVTVMLGFYGLLIFLPVFIFWRRMFLPVSISLFGLSYFYAVCHPWLPGRDGLIKSIPLTIISLAGLFVYHALINPLPVQQFFAWSVGLTGLSVFTAAEMQGMSPLMRGEQANWGWELVIGLLLAAIYWFVPLAIGWR